MKRSFSIQWVFFILGGVFWITQPDLQPTTLLGVFYSFFVGCVWTLAPIRAGLAEPDWKRILQPLFLLMLMMVSMRSVWIRKANVILFTTIALIHIRAFLISLSRFKGGLRVFGLIQACVAVLIFLLLFKEPRAEQPGFFGIMVSVLVTVGFLSLLILQRTPLHERPGTTNHS